MVDGYLEMTITIKNVLIITEYSKEFLAWVKKEYTIPNPEFENKLRMGLWLGGTPEFLRLYEIRNEQIILPYGCLDHIPMDYILDADIEMKITEGEDIGFPDNMSLYDYQQKAVSEMLKKGHGILQSAAGSGKTYMGVSMIEKLNKRALWLTHTKDLLNQSMRTASKFIDKSYLGTITEGKVNIGKGITFATVQTMSRMDLSDLKRYWDVIVVDEVHRLASSPTKMTMFGKVINSLSAKHKYGLSATVHRADGLISTTFAYVGDIGYIVPESDIKDKIMPVKICPVPTESRITRDVLNTDGTINHIKVINHLVEDNERNNLIAEVIADNSEESSLILTDRVNHFEKIISLLPPKMQSLSTCITGKTKKKVREEALDEMRSGKKRFLFATYSLAKEGLDIPRLSRLYMATPVKDYAVVTQSIGRIARTFKGKTDPICYDFVDASQYLNRMYKKRCTTYRKDGCEFIERSKK